MRKRKELFCVCCPHCGSIVAKTSSTEYTENKCSCGRKVASWVEKGCIMVFDAECNESYEMAERLKLYHKKLMVEQS